MSVTRPFLASAVALAMTLVAPVEASAQRSFEGVVTYQMNAEGQSIEAKFMSKGPRTRMEMTMPGMPGPIYILIDQEARVSRTVMESMGMYMEIPIPDEIPTGAGGDAPQVEKVGTSDTIAGIQCENYRFKDGNQPETEACIATGMGWFMGGMGNPMGGRGARPAGPDWASLAREFKDGLLPLRVRTRRGDDWSVIMVATAVVRGELSDDLFRLKPGLRKMGMPGGE